MSKCHILLIIATISACARADEYCMQLYRKDAMQTWKIKSGSVLCQINTFTSSYSDTIEVKAENGQLSTRFRSKIQTLDQNWKNSCQALAKTGIALNLQKMSSGVVVEFKEDDSKQPGSHRDSSLDGLGAFLKTSLFIKTGDIVIEGGSNPIVNIIFITLYVLIFCIASSVKFHFTAGALFLSILTLLLSLTQGAFNMTSLAALVINVNACCIISSIAGGLLWLKFDRHQSATTALILTLAVAVYGCLGGHFIQLISVTIFFVISAAFSFNIHREIQITNLSLACMLSNLMMAFNLLIVNTPATSYMEIITWNHSYETCKNDLLFGVGLYFTAALVIMVAVQVVLLCLSRNMVEQKPANPDAALANDAFI